MAETRQPGYKIGRATYLTALLHARGSGDADALARLVPLVYDDLRRLARSQARRAGAPESLLDGPFAQLRPEISPDGKWIAYQSDESGRFEIYVRPYPDVQSGRWQISDGGGTTPRWRADGREVFFHGRRGISAAAVESGPSFKFGVARHLFDGGIGQSRLGSEFDVMADGSRFLLLREVSIEIASSRADLVVLQHWLRGK